MPGPLAGVRILDFTWQLAGPFGVMQLADLGAEVWKIEPVYQEEKTRGPGPIVDGINTYFFSVNRGKKSIALDLRSAEGKKVVYDFVALADVVTENFTPGTMERLGFGYEELSRRNPRIVYASTSGFGQNGPYRERGAVDVIVQGMGGVMSITGHPGEPPARPGYSIGDMAGGLYTALGVVSALVERASSGRGQYLEVAMLDAQVQLLENAIVRHCATGEVPGPIGTRHPLTTPFQAFPTADGHVVVAGVKDWALFCAAIERDELIQDPRFETNALRTVNHAELEPILMDVFRTKPNAFWLATLEPVCLIGPMNTVPDIVADPQVAAREMLVELPAWNGRQFRVSGQPIKLQRTPAGPVTGADRAGGHTVALLKDVLGYSDQRIAALAAAGVIASPEFAS